LPIVIIDGVEYTIKQGKNMLEAALDHGLDLPYFCWHPAMHSVGACRQCAVKAFKDESDTKGKIVMSCMTPAEDGSRFSIDDPEAVEFRRCVTEWLMTNHPHDCPVCDEGGECHLQDMTAMTGHVYRRFRYGKRTYRKQYLGPFVTHEMNRCIQCWRCVRFYRDTADGTDFNVFGSRNRVYFGRFSDGVLESEFAGNLVEVCPTGVFTDKSLQSHYTRKWDLQTAPSICIHCALGCNTIPGERYGTLRRVRARYNSEVNGYFICDRGRYGYEFVNCDRRIRECKPEDAFDRAKAAIAGAKRAIGIGSPRASLESNYALRKLVGKDSFSTGLSALDQSGAETSLRILRDGQVRTPSLAEVQQADAILVLGADPTNEAPMLDFYIRQATKRARMDISRALKIPDWDAHAVATALQGARGPLYVVSPWTTKLDGIAVQSARLSCADTVTLGSEIARAVSSGKTDGDSLPARIAADLVNASSPLIVTSLSAGTDVIEAAAEVAGSVKAAGRDCALTIVAPEANTLGVAMLGGTSVEGALALIESGEADTLVVLENDLTRRVAPTLLQRALDKAAGVITIDYIETPLTSRADIALSSPAYVETDGTFVNNECRAQRFYQVFVPEHEPLPAWRTLQALSGEQRWRVFEDVLRDLADEQREFAGALEAAPFADWRSPARQKVARMPHRYSGRTAMHADVTVHEPRPPEDPGTPFAFSMQGDQNPVPGALEPRFWWPGWNSINSVTKFQIEVNGPLHGGSPGKRLLPQSRTADFELRVGKHDSPTGLQDGEVWLTPRTYIFGSEELSRAASGIAELSPPVALCVNSETAAGLSLSDTDRAEFEYGGSKMRLPVKIDEGVADGVATVPAGYPETAGITGPRRVKIGRAE